MFLNPLAPSEQSWAKGRLLQKCLCMKDSESESDVFVFTGIRLHAFSLLLCGYKSVPVFNDKPRTQHDSWNMFVLISSRVTFFLIFCVLLCFFHIKRQQKYSTMAYFTFSQKLLNFMEHPNMYLKTFYPSFISSSGSFRFSFWWLQPCTCFICVKVVGETFACICNEITERCRKIKRIIVQFLFYFTIIEMTTVDI